MLRTSFSSICKGFQLLPKRSLATNWYYAIDIPIKGKVDSRYSIKDLPKEFKQFTKHDSSKLRAAYEEYLSSSDKSKDSVMVSEDKLFCVNFKKMELKPIYWDGPSYEVRRGLWFKNSVVPIPELLASEIDDLSHKFKKDDPDGCIFELKTKSYEGIKYVLFITEEEAYLLPDLSGGSLHLKVLKSGIGQYLPINGTRITKYSNEKKKVKTNQGGKKSVKIEESATKLETQKQEQSLNTQTSWLNWDFYNQLPSLWNNEKEKESPENEYAKDLSNNVDSAYDDQDKSLKSSYDREIKHLVLCVHGIGQTLGKKYEYINFAHTVNLLRTNMKKLYEVSDDLKNINKANGSSDWKNNGGVQVLPITWRHSIGFETEPLEENESVPELPTLADITVKGILPLRKLFGDVAVDAILYEEPYYRDKILEEVCAQLNKTCRLFKERNPTFNGDVHVIGHSLGSVILFDILKDSNKYKLEFDTKKFFCLGSPVGLLKLIQRTRIFPLDHLNDSGLNINQPNCENLYNIYHTCDPVAYRMEPLIHPSMRNVDHKILSHFTELDGITSKVIKVGNDLLDTLPSSEDIKINQKDGRKDNKDKTVTKNKIISPDAKALLNKLNHLGRVDFAMSNNLFEVDMIAAIKSHVSYFEEPDIAGFILKEILEGKGL
ncbi:probable phospholipase YOR022C, mitochondrial [Monosporozyma servazzii]